jgi:glycosyltransferase involved in cell wall biosynthesis
MKASSKSSAFYTIVTPNYYAHAQSLMRSIRDHNPNQKGFIIVIGDAPQGVSKRKGPFEVIEFKELAKKNQGLLNLAFRYTAFQLCCALKPYVAEVLVEEYGIQKLIYLDSDIRVFSSFEDTFELLEKHPVVVTPHLLDPHTSLNDGFFPNEGTILAAGIFNMGFFGVNGSARGREFLAWWRERTFFFCEKSPLYGLFDDQKWVNLIPGLFPDAHILRHYGYNVAYWNLHERKLSKNNGKWLSGGQSLVFFHYSGWSGSAPAQVSPHQNRHSLEGNPLLEELYIEFIQALQENGLKKVYRLPYSYNTFSNHLPILPILRSIYNRAEPRGVQNFGNPFDADLEGSFFQWLTDPGAELVSPLALALRASRSDAVASLPYPAGKIGNLRIQEWASDCGLQEMKWPEAWQKVSKVCTARAKGQLLLESNLRKDHHKQPMAPVLGFGVNLIGLFGSEKGVGVSARRSAECLAKARVPFKECAVVDTRSENVFRKGQGQIAAPQADYGINLIHISPNDLEHFLDLVRQPLLKSRVNIGYWAWELSEVPQKFAKWYEYFDEIWVPSTFVQEAFSAVSPIPVVRVPHPIGFNWPQFKLESGKRPFTFLVTFDFDSVYERKNPEAAIEAFIKAFPDRTTEVRLLIKTMRADCYPKEQARLKTWASKDPRIQWIDAVYGDVESKKLLFDSDCYVSLHRSEGFGLSILESLYLEKPVIATDFSGNRDFLTSSTGFPVPYKSVKLQKTYGPYIKGAVWADPDVGEAAKLMRHVFENRKEAVARAKAGAELVRQKFSVDAVAAIYRRQLMALRTRVPKNV